MINKKMKSLRAPVEKTANNSPQGTFGPPPIFANVKTAVASNAPELRR